MCLDNLIAWALFLSCMGGPNESTFPSLPDGYVMFCTADRMELYVHHEHLIAPCHITAEGEIIGVACVCEQWDMDNDGDVDMRDVANFQRKQ